MAYSEEMDLIQNVKNLSEEFAQAMEKVDTIKGSMDDIEEIKNQLQDISNQTIAVVDRYQETLDNKSQELVDMLESGRSQLKQLTDDVETLVNLEVDFASIKDKIEESLTISVALVDLMQGGINVLMEGEIIPVEERAPYHRYLEVTSVEELGE